MEKSPLESESEFRSRVISGEEQKNGDVHVTFLIGEGDLINDAKQGISSDLLRKWHKLESWIGLVHNVHPSKNHPLAYFTTPRGLTEQGLIDAYKAESEKWGIGRFVKTKLVEMANGAARLLGIVKLFNTAKKMWNEGKFPLYSSCSLYSTQEKDGLVTNGVPIANSSVDKPAYGIELAKTHGQCEGGEECVTKLLENSKDGLCQKTIDILSSFKNNFSSHSGGKLQESSMENADGSSKNSETETKDAVTGTVETKSAETETESKTGTENENLDELREFKKKYLAMEPEFSKLKKKSKEDDEYRSNTDKRLQKIETEKVEGKIRNLIEKIPVSIFENKEDKREEAITSTMKLYGKLTEDELIGYVKDKYSVVEKFIKVSANKNSGLKEQGFISNNAPAANSEGVERKNSGLSILDAHKLISGG